MQELFTTGQRLIVELFFWRRIYLTDYKVDFADHLKIMALILKGGIPNSSDQITCTVCVAGCNVITYRNY